MSEVVKGIVELPTADLSTNGNVRIEAKASPELVASIADRGIIQPIVVRQDDDGWKVIAGHRRLDAAIQLGLAHVPVHIKLGKYTETDRIADQVAENDHRENLTAWERAQAVMDLKEEGLKHAEIASRLSIKSKEVSQLAKAGKLDLEDGDANQFTLDGLVAIADAVKETELPGGEIAKQLTERGQRDIYGAVRAVKFEYDEAELVTELAQLMNEWHELGITVVTSPPNIVEGETDRYGYQKKNPNVQRIVEEGYYGTGIDVPLVDHISEPCHVIEVQNQEGFRHTTWVHWCTDARSHKETGKSEVKAKTNPKANPNALSDDEKAQRRADREAKKLRQRQAGVFLTGKTNKAFRYEWAVAFANSIWREETTRAVVQSLILAGEIDPRPKGAEFDWYRNQLDVWLEARFGDDELAVAEWKIGAMVAYHFVEQPGWKTPFTTGAIEVLGGIEVPDDSA